MSQIVAFNYAALAPAARATAKESAREIHQILERTAEGIVQIGLRLMEVHKLLGPNFNDWLKAEFQFSQSVASNYEQAAEKFRDVRCLDRFQPSALCALIRKNVDPAAVDEAVTRARHGETITRKTAQRLIVKHASPGSVTAAPDSLLHLRSGIRMVSRIVGNLTTDQRSALLAELVELVELLGGQPAIVVAEGTNATAPKRSRMTSGQNDSPTPPRRPARELAIA